MLRIPGLKRRGLCSTAFDHNRLIAIEAKVDTLAALFTQGRLEMRTLLGILIALKAGIAWRVW